MEFLIELVLDLILEGSMEISSNKKYPKIIRYPLIAIIILFFVLVILGLFLIGIFILKESIIGGLFIIIIAIFLLISSIFKFKDIYLEKTK